jgi:hypothetical protein
MYGVEVSFLNLPLRSHHSISKGISLFHISTSIEKSSALSRIISILIEMNGRRGVRVTNDGMRRRLRCQPGTAIAYGRITKRAGA